MRELKSYSIDELEQLTGYDRRTISYYTAEGLLPKVGRRGPKTRYGQEFVDRLKFITKVKDLQDAGKLPSVKLEELARIIRRVEAEEGEETLVTSIRSQRSLQEVFARVLEQLENEPVAGPTGSEPSVDMFVGEAGIGEQLGLDDRMSYEQVFESRVDSDWSAKPAAKASRSMMDNVVSKASGLFGGTGEEELLAEARHKARQLNELVGQMGEIRQLSERAMRNDQSVQEQLPQLFKMVEQQGYQLEQLINEVHDLREQLDRERARRFMAEKKRASFEKQSKQPYSKAASNRPRPGAGPAETPKKVKEPRLQDRAKLFAKQNDLPQKDLRAAIFRTSIGGKSFWEFRLSPADLQRETLHLFCEGRGPDSQDADFIVLNIPGWFLAQPLGPLFQEAHGKPLRLRLSASDSNAFELLELPGMQLGEFRAS
jgi:DNA-binding transcriptional MerR regulator